MRVCSGLIVVYCCHSHPHTDHYTGKQLSPQALTCLHVMLWDKACQYFEVGHKQFLNFLDVFDYGSEDHKTRIQEHTSFDFEHWPRILTAASDSERITSWHIVSPRPGITPRLFSGTTTP